MTWLFVNIVAAAAFMNIMRWAQRSGRDMRAVGAVNYVVAASCFLGAAALRPRLNLDPVVMALGAATGAIYVATYFVLDVALKQCGVAISMAAARLSVVMPTAASIMFWAERPGWVQYAGIALGVAALPLLTYRRPSAAEAHVRSRWAWLLLPVLFGLNGAASIVLKYCTWAAHGHSVEFLGALFLTAAAASVAASLPRSGLGRWRDAGVGVLLGVANAVPNYAMYVALGMVDGAIAFPVQACGTVLAATLMAAVLWRERYSRRTLVGLGLAVIALVLVNVRTQ